MSFELRDYQITCANKAVNYLTSRIKNNGILVVPTGAGKSLIVADVARQLDDHTLILQPSKEILEQNIQKYMSYGNYASIFSASMNQKKIAKVTYATIGSVVNKMEAFSHFKYVIVDEAHFVNPKQGMYKRLDDHLGRKMLGLTATPYRLNTDGYGGSMLKFITRTRPRIFKDLIHYVQIRDLLDQGYLAKVDYVSSHEFNRELIKKNSTGADFDSEALRAYLEAIHMDDRAVEAIKHYSDRKGMICFVPFVENAEYIANKIDGACIVTAKTNKKDRADIIERFRTGKIKAIINVGILGIGFDYPELDTIIMARPTMSLALYYQQIGRGIRPHPEKESCLVVDLTDNYRAFGKIEDLVLHSNNKKPFIATGNKQLTNVYFEDKEASMKEPSIEMPFGKHKGILIKDIDTGYLQWLQKNCKLFGPMQIEVEKNLALRKSRF